MVSPAALPAPMFDTMAPVRLFKLGDILQEPLDPLPAMERARLLPGPPDAALDSMLAVAGPDGDTMLMIVQLRHLGGALARLRAIKLERDPAGVIRSNRPVLTGSTTTRVPAQRS